MGKYRKLVVAVIGLAVLLLGPEFFAISPEGTFFGIAQDTVVQVILAILTAIGIYQVPNDPMPD